MKIGLRGRRAGKTQQLCQPWPWLSGGLRGQLGLSGSPRGQLTVQGWLGGARGREANLLSLSLKCQLLSPALPSTGSGSQVCGFVFLQQPCDVCLPQGQGHRVTQTLCIREPGLPFPGCLAQSKMLHFPQASGSPSGTSGPRLQLV